MIKSDQQSVSTAKWTGISGEIVEVLLKTKDFYHTISIGKDAIEVEILKQQKEKSRSEYVFSSETGGPISPDSVIQMLHRVLERVGLSKVRFHDLKHTFATLALQNGVDVKTVSGMLDRCSTGFTLDTYAYVTTAAQHQAASTMGNILSAAVYTFPGVSTYGARLGSAEKPERKTKLKVIKDTVSNRKRCLSGCGDRT